MIPRVLKNFNSNVDGRGFFGRVDEAVLPVLSEMTDEYRGAGMNGPVDIVMGLEKMESRLTFAEHDAEVYKLFGVQRGNNVPFTLRGAMQRQGEDAIPMVVRIGGRIKQVDPGTWKAGERGACQITIAVNALKIDIDGVNVVDIDLVNGRQIINGVDQYASIRTAIGQ